jgi:orotate phosphoribosyltransferase/AMMECR1 domain-containing protein
VFAKPSSRESAQSLDERATLLDILRKRGILWAGPNEPVVDRRGETAPWMFYSWNISLTEDGAQAAANCLLAALGEFETNQLATFGATAVPLLTATVIAGGGRYHGLAVREQPKGHAAGRQIEGPSDRSKPVVLIDDSISSGRSFLAGAAVLERHGFTVLGGVCLVRFPGRGGVERAEALGYRMRTLFDIWDDIGMERATHVPGYLRVPDVRREGRIAEGLAPPEIARAVARQLLAHGTAPRPPRDVESPVGAPGGVWVSLRDRQTDERVARDGFWHFDPADADLGRDLVLATIKTISGASLTIDRLAQLKIAVTLFGALEPIAPRKLDFSSYGIVARSAEWPVKVGGALPNTQVFISEAEQLGLARRNAGLGELEPYDLFRHEVTKLVEEGEHWLPYGAPDPAARRWIDDQAIGRALTERARDVLLNFAAGGAPGGTPLSDDLIPGGFSAISVTLYRDGVAGCAISERPGLDEAVVAATRAALGDRRFGNPGDQVRDMCPSVSVLTDPELLRNYEPAAAARKLRLGLDSISVDQAGRRAFLLDSVAPRYEWDKTMLVEALLKKAGAKPAAADWTTYRTATWLWNSAGPVKQQFGFASPADNFGAPDLLKDLELLGSHLQANLLATGIPCYARSPTMPWRWEKGTAARVIHGLQGLFSAGQVLGRQDWVAIATAGVERCLNSVRIDEQTGYGRLELDGYTSGAMAEATLLTASVDLGISTHEEVRKALVDRLATMIRADGSIHKDGERVRAERDNDYLPSAILIAVAAASRDADESLLHESMSWQMRRFSRLHSWGQAGWVPQACRRLFARTGDRRYGDYAFEVADWAIDRQIERTGAFLTDLAPGGPGFHTAFVAEGVADAWFLADQDSQRRDRYQRAWWNAMRLVRALIVREEDQPTLADAAAVGGVRGGLNTSIMRVDYASHAIAAITAGLALARPAHAPETESQGAGPAAPQTAVSP